MRPKLKNMKKLFFLLSLFTSVVVFAQDNTVKELKQSASRTIAKDASDTTKKLWKKGGFFNINAAQGSLSNWAAGGDKFSLAVNSNLGMYAFYKKDKHSWDNTLDFNLGYLQTTSLSGRKNDDRIDFLSKYGYDIAPKWNVGALVNLRSQLFDGYTYDGSKKTFSSTFLSPAYVLVSPGIEYKSGKGFSAFLSPATVRWTIVANKYLSDRGAYSVDSGKHVKTELGAFATINYFKEFNKNISFKSRMDLFSNYLHNPQNVDLYFTNMLSMRLSKALALTYNVDMIYDDDVRMFGASGKAAGLQVKSMLGVGLMVKF